MTAYGDGVEKSVDDSQLPVFDDRGSEHWQQQQQQRRSLGGDAVTDCLGSRILLLYLLLYRPSRAAKRASAAVVLLTSLASFRSLVASINQGLQGSGPRCFRTPRPPRLPAAFTRATSGHRVMAAVAIIMGTIPLPFRTNWSDAVGWALPAIFVQDCKWWSRAPTRSRGTGASVLGCNLESLKRIE
ncbi:hypothetical protein BC826DRAFT_970651 [Russula brevipes]|nr:hypothetical protein BC826DRAFT_970651 [Russula brevipes]